MTVERGGIQDALGPLLADFERLTQSCRDLRAERDAERAARRGVERERDQLVAEMARLRARAGTGEDAGDELRALREERGGLERAAAQRRAAAEALAERCARLEADLEVARAELGVVEEERGCLEEQIRHLERALALLRAENRLLRREGRPLPGGGPP